MLLFLLLLNGKVVGVNYTLVGGIQTQDQAFECRPFLVGLDTSPQPIVGSTLGEVCLPLHWQYLFDPSLLSEREIY